MMRNRLEAISNICLIAVSLFIGGLLLYQQFGHKKSLTDKAVIGQKVDSKIYGPIKSDRSLVILLSTKCKYCAASTGFYRQIGSVSPKIDTVVAFIQPEAEARSYLQEKGIGIDRVIGSTNLLAAIPATPAVMLVDKSGKVVDAWVGKLPPQEEQDVLNKLKL